MFAALRFISFIMMSVILVVFSAAVVSGNKGVVESVFQPYADLLKEFLIERDLENDGLESAFDYEKALSQEKTMALLEKQDALLADFDIARLDTREKAVAFGHRLGGGSFFRSKKDQLPLKNIREYFYYLSVNFTKSGPFLIPLLSVWGSVHFQKVFTCRPLRFLFWFCLPPVLLQIFATVMSVCFFSFHHSGKIQHLSWDSTEKWCFPQEKPGAFLNAFQLQISMNLLVPTV
jgi:hypothetical protein